MKDLEMQVGLFIMLPLVKMYKDFFQRRIFSTHVETNNFSLRNLEYKNDDINFKTVFWS